jgi:hypothetical protein
MKPEQDTPFNWMHIASDAKWWMDFYSKKPGTYCEERFKEYCAKYDEAMTHLNPNYKPMGEPIEDDRID